MVLEEPTGIGLAVSILHREGGPASWVRGLETKTASWGRQEQGKAS